MMVEKNLPERLRPLEELAHNLWWCWNPGAGICSRRSIPTFGTEANVIRSLFSIC